MSTQSGRRRWTRSPSLEPEPVSGQIGVGDHAREQVAGRLRGVGPARLLQDRELGPAEERPRTAVAQLPELEASLAEEQLAGTMQAKTTPFDL